MALPVVLRWYTGNQMRFGSRRPCERFPICAASMVQAFREADKPPGSSPGRGFPKGSLNPGCLELVRLCRCRRGEDFSGGGMSGLKFEFPIYQYQSIHDYG